MGRRRKATYLSYWSAVSFGHHLNICSSIIWHRHCIPCISITSAIYVTRSTEQANTASSRSPWVRIAHAPGRGFPPSFRSCFIDTRTLWGLQSLFTLSSAPGGAT